MSKNIRIHTQNRDFIHDMNSQELRAIQHETLMDSRSMALCMGISDRQYKAYLYGQTRIPDRIERAAIELLNIGRTFRLTAIDRIDAGIKQVPNLARMGEW